MPDVIFSTGLICSSSISILRVGTVNLWFLACKLAYQNPELDMTNKRKPFVNNCAYIVCIQNVPNTDSSPPASFFSSACRQLEMIPYWHPLSPNLPLLCPPLVMMGGVLLPDPWPAGSSKAVIGVPQGLCAASFLFLKAHFPKGPQAPGSVGHPCICTALLEEDEPISLCQQQGSVGLRELGVQIIQHSNVPWQRPGCVSCFCKLCPRVQNMWWICSLYLLFLCSTPSNTHIPGDKTIKHMTQIEVYGHLF